jgi:hypothetical protein
VAGLIDQLYLLNADLLVNARSLLGGGLHGSHGTTNGYALLLPLRQACRGRRGKDQYPGRISQRLIRPMIDEILLGLKRLTLVSCRQHCCGIVLEPAVALQMSSMIASEKGRVHCPRRNGDAAG